MAIMSQHHATAHSCAALACIRLVGQAVGAVVVLAVSTVEAAGGLKCLLSIMHLLKPGRRRWVAARLA